MMTVVRRTAWQRLVTSKAAQDLRLVWERIARSLRRVENDTVGAIVFMSMVIGLWVMAEWVIQVGAPFIVWMVAKLFGWI